jgi:signal transduction histidine kinase
MMPGIDGYETCRRLREDPELRYVKIILVSAKAMTSERLRGYQAGADDYITKPFVPEELEAKVEVFLRLKNVEELDLLKTDALVLLNHETRTPLTGIRSTLELLAHNPEAPFEERDRLLAIAMGSCFRLESLLDKALLIAELRAEKADLTEQVVSFDSLLEAALDYTQPLFNERGVELCIGRGAGATLCGAPQYLRIALQALLESAVCNSPKGGKIGLGAETAGDDTFITLTDEGPGLRSFMELATPDLRHHSGGDSLGPALSHEIIRRHSGSITLDAGEDTITRIVIRLPAVAAKKAA